MPNSQTALFEANKGQPFRDLQPGFTRPMTDCPRRRIPVIGYYSRAEPSNVIKRWKFGVSEEPRHNRFLRRRQLPDILHPIEGWRANHHRLAFQTVR